MKKAASASEAVSAEHADEPVTPELVKILNDLGRSHFGGRPRKIKRRGGGRTNTVIEFGIAKDHYVFRMHADAGKVHDYLKEQWAMDAARAAGVPTPRVLEVASLPDGRPYMIMEHVEGVEAREVADRMVPLREMGRLAARLHGVRTRGFGRVFDWSSNRLSHHASWADYLQSGFDPEGRLALLLKHRMLSAQQGEALRAAVDVARGWRKPPVLQHGDLRLKNLIVGADDGRVRALIDWETCVSFPAPFWDLSIALHELGIDEKEAFLEGYGMTPARFAKLAPFVRLLNVLNYAHAVRSAAQHDNRERLAWMRLRLAAGLDLYQP